MMSLPFLTVAVKVLTLLTTEYWLLNTAFKRVVNTPNPVPATKVRLDENHLSNAATWEASREMTSLSRDIRRTTHLPNCPYSKIRTTLLRIVFTLPLKSPSKRWALTSPFHPYSPKGSPLWAGPSFDGRYIFCGTFHSLAAPDLVSAWGGPQSASCPLEFGLSSLKPYRCKSDSLDHSFKNSLQ